MKPSRFRGWVELEGNDIIQAGDCWGYDDGEPEDDGVAFYRVGSTLSAAKQDLDGDERDDYHLYRRANTAREYNPRVKPLPLP